MAGGVRLHSWLSPKCRVSPSALEGLGLFAGAAIAEGELICIWGGCIYSQEEVDRIGGAFPHFRLMPFEVYPGFFMASTSLTGIDDAERFNHSCEPNVGIRGQIVVLARRVIAEGEELTFDYETSGDMALDAFECRCGAPTCRGAIDGTAWRDESWRHRNNGWLSWFVDDRMRPA